MKCLSKGEAERYERRHGIASAIKNTSKADRDEPGAQKQKCNEERRMNNPHHDAYGDSKL